MIARLLPMLRPDDLRLLLVYVINQEHHEALHVPGGLGRLRAPRPARQQAITQADEQAATIAIQRAYDTAIAAGLRPEQIERQTISGRPEDAIVALAEQRGCDLIVLRARDEVHVHVPRGPASIGHVTRFILDHATCDVLLMRS